MDLSEFNPVWIPSGFGTLADDFVKIGVSVSEFNPIWTATLADDFDKIGVCAGCEANGNKVYVGRVLETSGNFIPAKIIPQCKQSFFEREGREQSSQKFECLSNSDIYEWIKSSRGASVANAVNIGGFYVGRGFWNGNIVVGRVDLKNKKLVSTINGNALNLTEYDVLTVKSQAWSNKHLQQNILELKNMTNQLTTQLNEAKVATEQLTTQMNEARVKLENIGQNAVPVGFIYVQLPRQQEPLDIWGCTMFWREITADYAGLFFRVAGGGSEPFGVTQEQNSPRLSGVMLEGTSRSTSNSIVVPPSGWSTTIASGAVGANYGGTIWGLKFLLSSAEVRPRNSAIRIWIRVR